MPGAARVVQEAALLQKAAQLGGVVRAELFAVADRQLEGRALQVVQQDLEVVGVDVGVLGRAVEEVLGMLDDVLVERRAGGHQHRERRGLAAARRGRRAARWRRSCPG